ncbi:hypothetical protein [Candidatus Poriferisodalis sp.]|uniref:hypothetical protein n=1 Tax=Candidatus Poriferisodalis sp. TaxID=3101277 RepID=UPI003D0B4E1E
MSSRIPKLAAQWLRPYISFTVFDQPAERGSIDFVCKAIRRYVDEDKRSQLIADGLGGTSVGAAESLELSLCIAYRTQRFPPWGRLSSSVENAEGTESRLHLAIVFESEGLIAIHSTDERIRDQLLRLQKKLQLGGVGLITRPALEEALLQGDVATFWMGEGAAGRGGRGPRSKTHHGIHLEDTIDQVDDQRYTLAGARATVGEDLLGSLGKGVIGTNLERSSFWLRRAKDWPEFVAITARILSAINDVLNAGGGRERFVVFARYVDAIDELEMPYDVSFVPPGEVPGETPTDEAVDACDWLSQHIAGIEATGRRSARILVHEYGGAECTIVMKPDRQGKSIAINPTIGPGNERLGRRFLAELGHVEPILYYGSGHTVSQRGIVAERFADATFGGWKFESLGNTDISTEKPGNGTRADIKRLGGQDDDRSLFGWIIRTFRSGWLFCDDGPDELFDFLHLDPAEGRLSVWHVKACASGSRRSIAVVPYEQVCAQVTKNIPSLSPQKLVDDLGLRHSENRLGDC